MKTELNWTVSSLCISKNCSRMCKLWSVSIFVYIEVASIVNRCVPSASGSFVIRYFETIVIVTRGLGERWYWYHTLHMTFKARTAEKLRGMKCPLSAIDILFLQRNPIVFIIAPKQLLLLCPYSRGVVKRVKVQRESKRRCKSRLPFWFWPKEFSYKWGLFVFQ